MSLVIGGTASRELERQLRTHCIGNTQDESTEADFDRYLVAEWPMSYLAQKLPTGKVISVVIMVWGAILMLTAACHNFAELAVCRFLMGCFESMITPVFMMLVGEYCTSGMSTLNTIDTPSQASGTSARNNPLELGSSTASTALAPPPVEYCSLPWAKPREESIFGALSSFLPAA